MRYSGKLHGTLLVTLFLLTPLSAAAQTLQIQPRVVDASWMVEEALRDNKGRAKTSLEGNGAFLRLTYQASQPLTITMVPLSDEGRFVPNDYLLLTLPQTDGATADINLTVSLGWSPGNTVWLLHLLTKDENASAGFIAVEFLPATPKTMISAFFRHAFKTEPYTPSSFHALHGYRIFALDGTILAGILLILACIIAVIVAKKQNKLVAALLIVLTFQGIYGLRFGLDLLRFSTEHLSGFSRGLYDEAGSAHQIARALREHVMDSKKAESATTVFVCRSGTNYKEKILRYAAYPIVITSEEASAEHADYALVMDADEWRVDNDSLHCADLTLRVRTVTDFPDGSVLFAIIR